eukprot:3308384-Rhodomonas_salina.1
MSVPDSSHSTGCMTVRDFVWHMRGGVGSWYLESFAYDSLQRFPPATQLAQYRTYPFNNHFFSNRTTSGPYIAFKPPFASEPRYHLSVELRIPY